MRCGRTPDVLVVGEMRTPEVIRLTLNAAETGHLVLATMHSATCVEALNRICMSFPAEIQGSIRAQLADVLVGVVCRRLEFLGSVQLRVPKFRQLGRQGHPPLGPAETHRPRSRSKKTSISMSSPSYALPAAVHLQVLSGNELRPIRR